MQTTEYHEGLLLALQALEPGVADIIRSLKGNPRICLLAYGREDRLEFVVNPGYGQAAVDACNLYAWDGVVVKGFCHGGVSFRTINLKDRNHSVLDLVTWWA